MNLLDSIISDKETRREYFPVAGERIYIAPSGVQKERIAPDDLFVLDGNGEPIESPAKDGLKISACTPLFMNAYRLRDAGAVLHSHSVNAMLATLQMSIPAVAMFALAARHLRADLAKMSAD